MAIRRELIEPTPGDKRYVRRNDKGQFAESVGVIPGYALWPAGGLVDTTVFYKNLP